MFKRTLKYIRCKGDKSKKGILNIWEDWVVLIVCKLLVVVFLKAIPVSILSVLCETLYDESLSEVPAVSFILR